MSVRVCVGEPRAPLAKASSLFSSAFLLNSRERKKKESQKKKLNLVRIYLYNEEQFESINISAHLCVCIYNGHQMFDQ